jgi:hypothetical protein
VKRLLIGTVLVGLPLYAQGWESPSQVDLKAAHCEPILQRQVAVLNNAQSIEGLMDEDRRFVAERADKLRSSLRRLEMYLVARTQYVDPIGMAVAQQAGEEDWARWQRDLAACKTTCKNTTCLAKCRGDREYCDLTCGDPPCVAQCSKKSEALARIETCKGVPFLPF